MSAWPAVEGLIWLFEVDPEVDDDDQEFEGLKLTAFLDRLVYAIVPQHRDRSEALRRDLVKIGEAAAQKSGSWA